MGLKRVSLRTVVGVASVLAHRGGRGEWAENTVEAFIAARKQGADGVELDVRLTSDGAVVVHHDPKLADGTVIARSRRAELPPWVPGIAEVVSVCEGMFVDVEMKLDPPAVGGRVDAGACRALTTALSEVLPRSEKIFVSSFWPDAIVAFGELAPATAAGLLVHPADRAARALSSASDMGCSYLLPHHTAVGRELVDACHELSMEVGTWTVNDPAGIRAVLDAGVDSVITDEVATAVEVTSRGRIGR